jgi:hypothetical protein
LVVSKELCNYCYFVLRDVSMHFLVAYKLDLIGAEGAGRKTKPQMLGSWRMCYFLNNEHFYELSTMLMLLVII